MKFSTYVVVRIFMGVVMLFILLLTIFFVMRILPGDPVLAMVGEKAPQKEIERIRQILGLDKPIHIQFIIYVKEMLRGDFGESFLSTRKVSDELFDAFPTTIELTIGGLLIGIIFGIPIGIIGAIKKGSIYDHFNRLFTFWTYSMPVFWLGLLFQLFFGVYLGILPITGRSSANIMINRITGLYTLDSIITLNYQGFIMSIKYLALPSITLGIVILPIISRISRASMLEQMKEEYITTARAKGIPENVVVYRHALRNALIPIVTVISMAFAGLLGGSILVETIFSFPGLGRLLITALLRRDFPIVQAVVFFYASIVIIVNIITDILYGFLDPRVRR